MNGVKSVITSASLRHLSCWKVLVWQRTNLASLTVGTV